MTLSRPPVHTIDGADSQQRPMRIHLDILSQGSVPLDSLQKERTYPLLQFVFVSCLALLFVYTAVHMSSLLGSSTLGAAKLRGIGKVTGIMEAC